MAARSCLPRKLPLPGVFALEERDARKGQAAISLRMTGVCPAAGVAKRKVRVLFGLGECYAARWGSLELPQNKRVGGRGVHPPGKLHEYQNRGVAAKGVCMNIKTKGVIFCGLGRRKESARRHAFAKVPGSSKAAADGPAGWANVRIGDEALATHDTL
jgi:hypothetical protein